MVSVHDSRILGPLFAEPGIARLFDDSATVRAMARVEAALARAEAAAGIIPHQAAARITAAAGTFTADLDALGRGV